MLLLETAKAERLDAYSEFVRSQVTQFGDEAWSFISRADTRLRSEHLDRLRRQLVRTAVRLHREPSLVRLLCGSHQRLQLLASGVVNTSNAIPGQESKRGSSRKGRRSHW